MYVLANCKLPVQIFCLFFYWTFFLLSLSRGSSLCILDSSLRQLHALQYFLSAFGFSLHFLHHVFQKADVFNLFCFWGKKKKTSGASWEFKSIHPPFDLSSASGFLAGLLSFLPLGLSLINPTNWHLLVEAVSRKGKWGVKEAIWNQKQSSTCPGASSDL